MPYAHPNNEEGLGTLQVLAETNIGNDPACFTPTENTGTTTNYRVSMYSFSISRRIRYVGVIVRSDPLQAL